MIQKYLKSTLIQRVSFFFNLFKYISANVSIYLYA